MQITLSTTMTCAGCLKKLQPLLDGEPMIDSWESNLKDPRKLLVCSLAGDGDPNEIIKLINRAGFKAQLVSTDENNSESVARPDPIPRFQLSTYQPLFLVVVYVAGLSAFAELRQPGWQWGGFMTYFMGFFFLGFAFFKLLNISKFADAFSTYDIVAKRSRIYALAYPWIEVGLGLMFITGTWLLAANVITAAVMSVGLIGVISAVRKKQAIQCACLGTAFNLPMSVVTIIENSVMIAMAIAMLVPLIHR